MRPTVHVVPHTHWDREWYQTEDRTRHRLVAVVDEAIEALQDNPAIPSFMLDGQIAVVDDYLSVRPEREDAVRELIKDGRLIVGPWYVLADELLCTDEVLVRNLLEGKRRGAALGGWLEVGYSPDAFGHPGALPTLLNGFGIERALVWRGYGGRPGEDRDLFQWTSPDGSRVLTHHLPRAGYDFGAGLPGTTVASRARWAPMLAELESRAAAQHLLVLNGADHHALQRDVDRAVKVLDTLESRYEVRLSSLEDYFEAAADGVEIGNASGELRWSYGYTWTLQGVHATRSRTKRVFADAETRLVRWAEPQAALAWIAGGENRQPQLRDAWRRYLLGCAHDAIGGCCSDAVAADVHQRVGNVAHSSAMLFVDAVFDRIGLDRTASRRNPSGWKPQLVTTNPSPAERSGIVEATVSFHRADVPVGRPGDVRVRHDPVRNVMVHDGKRTLPVQILDRSLAYDRFDSPRDYPDQDVVEAVRVAVQVPRLPALGVRGFSYGPGRARSEAVRDPVRSRGGGLRASWCSIRPGVRGFDVRVGARRVIARAPEIWSERDEGDTYTFQSVGDGAPLAARWRPGKVDAGGPLVGIASRPFVIRDRVRGVLHVRIEAESRLIRFLLLGENLASGHRVRVAIPVRSTGRTLADNAFGPVERRREDCDVHEFPDEWPVRTAPMHRYVSVPGPEGGVTVFARGIYEYELTPDDYLALTVIRSVDQLSRGDLRARPGHAGWPEPTPAARELGSFTAEFAIALDAVTMDSSPGDWARIERAADEFHAPLAGRGIRQCLNPVSPVRGPSLVGEGLVFKSLKQSEAGDAIVLRCVNPTGATLHGQWIWPGRVKRAALARLDEQPVQVVMPSDGGTVEFEAGPRAVVTVLVWPADT